MFNELTRDARINTGRANGAAMGLLRWLADDDEKQQEHYVRLRKWYDGQQSVPLTDRQREYLAVDSHFEFALNYLRLPIDLCIERLHVAGFDGPDGIGGRDGLLMRWWAVNRMDGIMAQVHRACAKDGDTYVLVSWDNETNTPIFTHETAYDGDEGVKVHYLSNRRREMTAASKRWKERRFNDNGQVEVVRRMNIYKPDVIEKYIMNRRGVWEQYSDEGDGAWPVRWEVGAIPVIHFRWGDDGGNWGESELENLIPIQELINKAVLDEAEAADKTGQQILTLTGAKWPDDQKVAAGDVLSVSADSARWGSIPAGDLAGLQRRVADNVMRLSQASRIPLTYFQLTGQVASAETQAADDSQLVAKVTSLSTSIGNSWEDVMMMALRIGQAYGSGIPQLRPDDTIETQWKDPNRVDPLLTESRRAAIVQSYTTAGADIAGVVTLPSLGYSQEEQELLIRGDFVDGIMQ